MAILNAPQSGVTVRMYRQGLGDCFLLAFPRQTGKPFYMLIDCGIAKTLAPKHAGPSLEEVAEHIKTSTGGRLDLLVVTHAHWDHVAGFYPSQASARVFQSMQVDHVWLPWTENPHDNQATGYKKVIAKAHDSLRAALSRASNPASVQHSSNVLDFLGAAGGQTDEAVRVVTGLVKKGEPKYLDPAQLHTPQTFSDVKARLYVLGPPRDMESLRRMDPRRGESYPGNGKATRKGAALTQAQAFLLGAAAGEGHPLSDEDRELGNLCYPFGQKLRIPTREAKQDKFFKTHYYETVNEAWRRVDDDWLGASEGLVAYLDNYVNNTSLALAIELVNTHKVLVFAADAQMGNWQSWGDRTWTVEGAGHGSGTVKIQDLLENAVLYKVGHHGSENASFKEYVDLMKNPELISMLPVDEKDAAANGWHKMPWLPLVRHLRGEDSSDSAKRIVVKMDEFPAQKLPGISTGDWQKFKMRYEEDRFYMQYTVAD